MLLHLDDVYWTTEGRLSIDACLAAVAFLGLAILATFPLPTDTAGDRLGRIVGDGLIALVGCFVVVTLLKGKLKLGLFGIVFAPLAVGGALRLAKPTSIWARRLYPEDGRRRRRSEARFAAREARWTHRRDRVVRPDRRRTAPRLEAGRHSSLAGSSVSVSGVDLVGARADFGGDPARLLRLLHLLLRDSLALHGLLGAACPLPDAAPAPARAVASSRGHAAHRRRRARGRSSTPIAIRIQIQAATTASLFVQRQTDGAAVRFRPVQLWQAGVRGRARSGTSTTCDLKSSLFFVLLP